MMDDKMRSAFGFLANHKNTDNHNAFIWLTSMPAWYYFNRPTNLAFHNFTSTIKPPSNLRSLLGLGLKFIPTPTFTNNPTNILNTTLEQYTRNLSCKTYYAVEEDDDNSNTLEEEEFDKKMYIHSKTCPPDWKLPFTVVNRREIFKKAICNTFQKSRCASNLLPSQRRALRQLQQSKENLLVVQCDKNLGPAIIERDKYIMHAINHHFKDSSTYQKVPKHHVPAVVKRLKKSIIKWIDKYKMHFNKHELKYLQAVSDAMTHHYQYFI